MATVHVQLLNFGLLDLIHTVIRKLRLHGDERCAEKIAHSDT